jgi:hypothetical protein
VPLLGTESRKNNTKPGPMILDVRNMHNHIYE